MAVKNGGTSKYGQKSHQNPNGSLSTEDIRTWIDGIIDVDEKDAPSTDTKVIPPKKRLQTDSKNELDTAILDFYLSRQAMLCTAQTMRFYHFTLGRFSRWLENEEITSPKQIIPSVIRKFMSELASNNLKAWSIHSYARVIRTFLRFCYQEKIIEEPVKFPMPRLGRQRLPVLNADQLRQLIKVCKTPREKALVLFMADTGLRLSEVINLNWADINLETGMIVVRVGKGNKARLVAAGSQTCRALLALKKREDCNDYKPVFQTKSGKRLQPFGLRSIFTRLSKAVGFNVGAHIMRRTCATLALKAGQDLVTVQATLGHASIETTRGYIQLLDEEIIENQRRFSPIDHLG